MTRHDRLTCEEVFRRIDDYVDRELSAREMALVREHLETCAACATEYAFEAAVLGAVRDKVRRIDVPSDLLTRVEAQLEAARKGDRPADD